MNEFIFKDLHDICSVNDFNQEEIQLIFESMDYILKASQLLFKEGLLALEDLTMTPKQKKDNCQCSDLSEDYGLRELDRNGFENNLAELILLIVDGTDREIVKKIGMYTYCSSGFSPLEKILYLIYLEGVLQIQAGCSTLIIHKILQALLPPDVRLKYKSVNTQQ